MLVDIPFYDKPQNENMRVDTWHGGLTLTHKNGDEEDVWDVALPAISSRILIR